MTKLICILMAGLVFEAIGVVFLSRGLKALEVSEWSVSEAVRVVRQGVAQPSIWLGMGFEAMFFGCLVALMARGEVSFIWPLTSLGFVLTTLAAQILLHEQVSGWRWCGVLLIVAGAALVSWTEHAKGGPEAERVVSAVGPAESGDGK